MSNHGRPIGGVSHRLSPAEIARNRCDANLRFYHEAYAYTPRPVLPATQGGLLHSARDFAGAVRRNPQALGEIFRQPIIHNDRATVQQDQMRLYMLNRAQSWGQGQR